MWDPSFGDPNILDLEEAQLKTIDAPLAQFAESKSLKLRVNYHNSPDRRVFGRGADDIERAIGIRPFASGGKYQIGTLQVFAIAWFDEGRVRFSHFFPELRQSLIEIAELQQDLLARLEQMWSELEMFDRDKIKRLGRRSELPSIV